MTEVFSPVMLWVIIGLVLLVAEMFIPGLIIAFFGLGALISALTTWLGLTPAFPGQILVFIGTSLLFLFLFHGVWKKLRKPRDMEETTNFNIEIGKIVPVMEFIDTQSGGGKVRYQGALWNARCSVSVPPGDSVRVVGCDNLTLIVETMEKEGE